MTAATATTAQHEVGKSEDGIRQYDHTRLLVIRDLRVTHQREKRPLRTYVHTHVITLGSCSRDRSDRWGKKWPRLLVKASLLW